MFYIALGILVVYLTYIFYKFKCIPNSISDTFYLGANWLFTVVIGAIGFTTTAALLNVTPELYQFIAFLTGVGLVFVSAAPHFKERTEGVVHFSGALLFAISSQIWALLFFSPWVLLTWVFIIPVIKSRSATFWAEIICIVNLTIAYIFGI